MNIPLWSCPPSPEPSPHRAVLKERRSRHPFLFRIEDEYSQTIVDQERNRIATCYSNVLAAEAAIRRHSNNNTDPFQFDIACEHCKWRSEKPSPYISATRSPRWAFWECYSRLFQTGKRYRKSDKVRIVIVDASRLTHVEDANAILDTDTVPTLRRFTNMAQESLVFAIIPETAILSIVDVKSDVFREAVERLYPGICTDSDVVDNSFRDAWKSDVHRWKYSTRIGNYGLGRRGAALAVVLLDDVWNLDWTGYSEDKGNGILRTTFFLAEQILLDKFNFYTEESHQNPDIFHGINDYITETVEKRQENWHTSHELPVPELDVSISPNATADDTDIEALVTSLSNVGIHDEPKGLLVAA
ncbi:hypothetical protein DACRYDRAFT_20173 [Dacryopinax primogenitus]|uniref:DUF7587 domain-containing protein n=1 Tax=Dacryopinax primogenitus (strain DJM 731) TaxID=1858805 RepID=M5GGN4_DACPD|nr:uncharacterized protein DACRYDRAFT_20173 [Dacryopinax primogenitus]EJU05793.1 hypothetical protein DACRYDRAFT_20173 [Dacryopinax primogenitus]